MTRIKNILIKSIYQDAIRRLGTHGKNFFLSYNSFIWSQRPNKKLICRKMSMDFETLTWRRLWNSFDAP